MLHKKPQKTNPEKHRFYIQNDTPPSTFFLFLGVPLPIDFRSGPQVATEAKKVTQIMEKCNENHYFFKHISK